MHRDRFWSYFLFVLLAGWAVLGAYPIGTPISMNENPAAMSFARHLQLISIITMVFVCLAGMMISSFVFVELLKVRTVEEARTLSAQRAARLSRTAPFGILGLVAMLVWSLLAYRSGALPGFVASLAGGISVFILLCIIVAVRSVLYIYHPPDE